MRRSNAAVAQRKVSQNCHSIGRRSYACRLRLLPGFCEFEAESSTELFDRDGCYGTSASSTSNESLSTYTFVSFLNDCHSYWLARRSRWIDSTIEIEMAHQLRSQLHHRSVMCHMHQILCSCGVWFIMRTFGLQLCKFMLRELFFCYILRANK